MCLDAVPPDLNIVRVKEIGDEIGVNWDLVDINEFYMGVVEEQEHSGILGGEATKVIEPFDYKKSAMIAYEHILERPDYYTQLEKMEQEGDELYPSIEAKAEWVAKNREENYGLWLSALNPYDEEVAKFRVACMNNEPSALARRRKGLA